MTIDFGMQLMQASHFTDNQTLVQVPPQHVDILQ